MSEGPSQPVKDQAATVDAQDPPLSVSGTLKTIAFILLIQLFAISITKVNAPAIQASGVSYQPAGTSSAGSVTNVLILVAFVLVATVVGVWLARRRRVKLFMGAIFLATGLALFLLTLLASIDLTSNYFSAYDSIYLSLAFASFTIVVLTLVTLRKIPAWSALFLTGLLSAEVGSYFASTIPILTALILPVAFSVYDIYTVFKG
ncbi:MAG TPA: hypothetical protein VEH01_04300, partial [Nitrososphaerales archaeon]|nr:hypothetical protein [Nitrososphaerales archaeon]